MSRKLLLILSNFSSTGLENDTIKLGVSRIVKFSLFCSLFLLSTAVFGQITLSPGGVDTNKVAIWLKADVGVDTSSSPARVDDWFDQSQYDLNGTHNNDNKRPQYVYQDNNFNPSIYFETPGGGGSHDELDFGDAVDDTLMMGAEDFSIYAVAYSDSTTDGVLFSDDKCGANATSGYILRFNSTTKRWRFYGGVANPGTQVSAEAGKSSTKYSLISVNRSGQTYTIKNNEDSTGTGTAGSPINYASTGPDFSERWLGSSHDDCGDDNFDGNLSELIIIRYAVSATEDRQIRSYLALKYGLTLPDNISSYLAADGTTAVWNSVPYWHDVAGIGRDDDSGYDQRVSKSQDRTAIVTMATDNDFTSSNIDMTRSSLTTDASFLVWGNNDLPASNAWTLVNAPTDFAILEQVWRVKETGTVGALALQVDVNNTFNNIPTFADSLFLFHGPSISGATPMAMSETSPGSGIWTITGVDFGANDFFTFGVKNKVIIEFSHDALTSTDEAVATPFPNVFVTGTINLPTEFAVEDNPITATPSPAAGEDYAYIFDTIQLAQNVYNAAGYPLPGMTLVDDFVDEGGAADLVEFEFDLTSSVGVAIGNADGVAPTNDDHLYTITDDDTYSVAIEVAVGGDALEGTSDVQFRVHMVGAANLTGTDLTGTISLSGSANSGADYTALGAAPHFTIVDGGTEGFVTVSIIDDMLLEGTETLIGEIATLSAGASITGSPATANITDDELTGVQVEVITPVDAIEGASLSYTIALTGGVVNHSGAPITGAITYTGTATTGADFVATPTGFSIPNLGSSDIISVFAIDDQSVEMSESVIAGITTFDVNGSSYSSPSSASANILDQDNIGLTISVSSTVNAVSEGVGILTYDLELDGFLINETGGPITGTVVLSGTALATGGPSSPDFTDVTTFTIPDNSGTGTIDVSITDDGFIEGLETIIATISSPTPFGTPNGTNNGISVNIADNDSGGLQISIGSPVNAIEGPPSGSDSVTFDVFVIPGTGVPAADVTGVINYTAGTAVIGSDFDTLGASVFVIPAGDTITTVVLPIINDGASEPQETVIASFSAANPSIGSYVNTSSTAYIDDDDAQNLIISIDTITSGTEGGSDVLFLISLDAGNINGTGGPITGSIGLSGTALDGDDYSFTPPLQFSIPNNASIDTVLLDVTNDFDVEFTETVIAKILTTSSGNIASVDSAMAFIFDNELPALSISALQTGVVHGEEGVTDVTFTVSIDNGWENQLGQPITGDISYAGSATLGDDYAEIIGGFSIPNGLAAEVHTLTVDDDFNIENLEFVQVTISNASHGVVSPDSIITANIVDNDSAAATLVITNTIGGTEAPSPIAAEFVVSFANGLQNQTGVPITGTLAISGTATDTLDFTSVDTFTIADNSLSAVLTFPVIDDILEEGTETIIVELMTATLGVIGPDSIAVAEIIDDDTDSDNDGLTDLYDPVDFNIDWDCDGIFDGCEADFDDDGTLDFPDADGDGIRNACDADSTGNGVVDNGPDINGDGLNDVHWDPTDDDSDLLPNHVDPNDNNIDTDGDGITDGADADVDGDGILDNGCDFDGDGIHDVADADDDGIPGVDPGNTDSDGDGIDARWDMSDIQYEGQQINYIVSPNGDGVNETLVIQGIQVIERHELVIFNRYGEPVYVDEKYNNNWAGEVNQSTSIGTDMLGDGVYYYTLDVRSDKGVVRGYIEIRR